MLSALHTSWHTVKVSFTHSSLGASRVTSSSAGVAVTQTMFKSCSGSAKAATIGPCSESRVSERVSVVLTTTVSEMTIAAGTGCTGLSMLSMPADLRKKGALCTSDTKGVTLREVQGRSERAGSMWLDVARGLESLDSWHTRAQCSASGRVGPSLGPCT